MRNGSGSGEAGAGAGAGAGARDSRQGREAPLRASRRGGDLPSRSFFTNSAADRRPETELVTSVRSRCTIDSIERRVVARTSGFGWLRLSARLFSDCTYSAAELRFHRSSAVFSTPCCEIHGRDPCACTDASGVTDARGEAARGDRGEDREDRGEEARHGCRGDALANRAESVSRMPTRVCTARARAVRSGLRGD